MALAIAALPAPSFGNFVVGRNAEPVTALRALCMPRTPAAERILYLWGPQGSGRTHLLHAVSEQCRAEGLPVAWFPHERHAARDGLLLVDDVQRMDDEAQVALFHALNAARDGHGRLVAMGDAPPGRLRLRPDLETRLAWGLVYRLHPLSDDEKRAALTRHAVERGIALPEEVSGYLLRHGQRDLPSLMATLDALDRLSLETHRPVTVPLLREVLGAARRRQPQPDIDGATR
jgi:DnaA family protein